MSNDNDLIAIAALRCKKELGKNELDFKTDLLPYLAEHKNEIQKELEDVHLFREGILKEQIKEHIKNINDLLDLL